MPADPLEQYLAAGFAVWLPAPVPRHLWVDPAPPGTAEGAFPFAGAVHVVTAHNPGRVVDNVANRRAHAALLAEVLAAGWSWCPTIGGDRSGGPAEPGVCLLDAGRPAAVALGRRHGQDSLYEWRAEALEVVGCRDPRSATIGWRLSG